MKLQRLLLLPVLLLAALAGNAQTLKKDINLRVSRDKTTIRSIDLFAGNVIIGISQKGKVRLNALPGTQYAYLDPFDRSDGRFRTLDNNHIDYYDNFEESRAGKLKAMGDIAITYYDKFDGFENIGRVKNIGGTALTYYDKYDGFDNIGKIRSIGGIAIKYYDRFDGSDVNGKLRSVGNIVITYYDQFDGDDKNGHIKAIIGDMPHITISGLSDDEIADTDAGF